MADKERQTNTARTLRPATNFVELGNDYGLEIEMPGVDRANIGINVEGRELEIVGEKTMVSSDWEPLVRETCHCVYRRTFTLGDEIDRDNISARFDKGVLYLTLPKSQAVLPKRIEIA
ncbi:MAG: Hsp20/alpha crystallin family protein [Verrucomicrobia bacterium]|nr:Hsp20/alpha crystallin family protein [Verrucomicrobiota bacterium]